MTRHPVVPPAEIDDPGAHQGAREGARRLDAPLRGSALLLLGRFLAIGGGLLVQVLIVRHLSQTAYGDFAYALAVVNVLTVVVGLGLEQAVQRFAAIYDEQGRRELIAGALVLQVMVVLVLGTLVVVVVATTQSFLVDTSGASPQAVHLLAVLAVLAPLMSLDGMVTGLFAVYARPTAIFWRRYVLAPGLKVAVAVWVVVTGAGVHGLAWGYVAATVVGLAMYAVVLRRILVERGVLGRGQPIVLPTRELLGFTARAVTADLVVIVLWASDVIIVGWWGGSDDVALLQAVQPLANGNLLVFYAMIPLFIPEAARLFTRGDGPGVTRLLRRGSLWIVLFTFPAVALTTSLAEPLTPLLFGPEYADSAPVLAAMAVGTYVLAAFGLTGLTLKAVGELRVLAWSNVGVVLLNVPVNIALVVRLGPVGVAVGTAGALAVLSALKCWAVYRATGAHVLDRAILRSLLQVTLSLVALHVLVWRFHASLAAAMAVTVVLWCLLLHANRAALQVDAVFPELRRSRVMGLLLVAPRRPVLPDDQAEPVAIDDLEDRCSPPSPR